MKKKKIKRNEFFCELVGKKNSVALEIRHFAVHVWENGKEHVPLFLLPGSVQFSTLSDYNFIFYYSKIAAILFIPH